MRSKFCWLFGAMFLIAPVASITRAADAPASQPATAPTGAPIEATDQAGLKAAVGKTVTVHGKVSGTGSPKSGSVLFINFEGANRDFTVVIRKANMDAVNKSFDGDVAKAVKGKSINVTGEITLYKDKPEIEVTKPEQINVLEDEK